MNRQMVSNVHLPSELLKPFVKSYLVIESQDELVNRVLPDTSMVMVFRFKGKVNYRANDVHKDLPSLALSGLRKSGRLIQYEKGSGNILVLFKEAGASAFVREPLHELFEDSVSLDNFAGYQNLSVIEEQLAQAEDHQQRINLIERLLLSRLYNRKPDLLIQVALEKIHVANGQLRIKELANALCISQDAFEKRFRRTVGVSPKQFSYIIRMKSIVNRGLKKQSLAEIAFDAGYFDQPHFTKDFKMFTGLTPTEFLKLPAFW